MSRLLKLLYSGQIKRWQEQVSTAIDSVLGGTAFAFLQAAINNPQAVAQDSDIIFDQVIADSGDIAYDASTGVFTLPAGGTYRLQGDFRAITFSDPTGGVLVVNWVDADDNSVVSTRSPATFFPMTGTGAVSSNQITDVIFTPAAGQETVRLRVTLATGTATLSVGVATVTRLR